MMGIATPPLPLSACFCGCCLIQFNAICDGVLFISFSIACTSAAIEIFLSFTNEALMGLLSLYLFCSLGLFCLLILYFPERTPPPKGDMPLRQYPRHEPWATILFQPIFQLSCTSPEFL